MARQKNTGTPVSAAIDTQFNDDSYHTHHSKKGRGGPFQVKNLQEMFAIPVDRLHFNSKCTVSEDLVNARPRTTYVLKKLPLQNINDVDAEVLEHPEPIDWPDYRIVPLTTDESNEGFFLNFWVVDSEAQSFDGEYEETYAPDYDGSYYTDEGLEVSLQPPFPYSKDEAWNATNWSEVLDNNTHMWKRIRYGQGKWSKPFRIYSFPQLGDEPTTRFKWVLTNAGAPARPKFMKNDGITVNTDPEGWTDVPQVKPIGDYTLWEIRGVLNGLGEIKKPWLGPFKIAIDGDLIRYSDSSTPNPNSIAGKNTPANDGSIGGNALTLNGWYADPQPNTQFRAKRTDNGDGSYTEWVVEQIGNEGALTQVRIYKLYPKILTNYILNNPDAIWPASEGGDDRPFRPQGDAHPGWQDAQISTLLEDMINFESSAWFYNNGKKKTKWSDPVPVSPEDIYNSVIDTGGVNNFKYNPNTVPNRDVTEITLTAKLYRGIQLLNLPQAPADYDIEYEWTRVRNGASTLPTTFGTNQSLTIDPDDVDQVGTFQVRQRLNDGKGGYKDFYERIDIFDFQDGNNARSVSIHRSSDFFVTKQGTTTPSTIKLEAFSLNLTYDNDASHVSWFYGNRGTDTWTQIAGQHNDVYELLPSFFDANKSGDSLDFKVEIIDDVTGTTFIDSVTVGGMTLNDGVADLYMALSNDYMQVPVNADGTLVSGNPSATYKTSVQVYSEGNSVTNDYTIFTPVDIRVTANGPSNTVSVNVDNVNKRVELSSWGTDVIEAFVQIALTHASLPPVIKEWQLKRVFNGAEVILQADIDVDAASPSKGFYFKPGDVGNKVLIAQAYINGQPIVDYTGYTFAWEAEGLTGSNRTFTITPEDVDVVLDVKLTITNSSGVSSQTRIKIEDIPDSVGLDEVFYPGEDEPEKPNQMATYYEACTVTTITGAKSAGQSINIPMGGCQGQPFSVIVSAYNKGGADWRVLRPGGTVWAPGGGNEYYDDEYYIFHYHASSGVNSIQLVPDGATTPDTKIKVVVQPNNTKWCSEILKESVYKSYKRANEDQTKWVDPFRFVGEQGKIGRPGAYQATFMSIHPINKTSVARPSSNVAPENPGTRTLKASFQSNGVTWYSQGNLPSVNYSTDRLWSTHKLLRFDEDDNFVSSSVDEWTTPQPEGGTDGLKPDTTVFIFRRQRTKPTGSNLPFNNLDIEESGGPRWSITVPAGNDQLWMCLASFENNVVTDKYKQKTNWSEPAPFEATGSKTAYMYHPIINNDPRDEPPEPNVDPEIVLSSSNSYSAGTWVKDSNRIEAGWKAEAYYNGSWSIWFITPLQGPAGLKGEDGSVIRTLSTLVVNSPDDYDEQGAKKIRSTNGNEGDYYLVKDTQQLFKKGADNVYTRETRLGNKIWNYDQLGTKYNQTEIQFKAAKGTYGDLCLHVQAAKIDIYECNGFKYPENYKNWNRISTVDIDSGYDPSTAIRGGGLYLFTKLGERTVSSHTCYERLTRTFTAKSVGLHVIDCYVAYASSSQRGVKIKLLENGVTRREVVMNAEDNASSFGDAGYLGQIQYTMIYPFIEGRSYRIDYEVSSGDVGIMGDDSFAAIRLINAY